MVRISYRKAKGYNQNFIKNKKEGESISTMFDGETSSTYVNWYDIDNI